MNYSAMLVYMAVTAVTPGPNNLMCLYLGASAGFKGARRFLCGSMTGLTVKMLLCGMLNVLLARQIPAVIPYLKWIGAAYMLYLAAVMVRSGFRETAASDAAAQGAKESTVVSGLLLQCLNGKSWIAAVSIFSVYVIPYGDGLGAVLPVTLIYMVIVIAASLIWVFFGQAIEGIYRTHRRLISLLMGGSLAVCAVTALL